MLRLNAGSDTDGHLLQLEVDDALVVVDRVLRRDQRIGIAVIQDELAASRAQREYVGIGRVRDRREDRVVVRDVGVEVERRVVPR